LKSYDSLAGHDFTDGQPYKDEQEPGIEPVIH
jgi:hypothetical protein